MLIIMEDWNVHNLLEGFLDIETVGSLDIFEVYSTEGWAKVPHTVYQNIRVVGIHTQVDGLHAGKFVE